MVSARTFRVLRFGWCQQRHLDFWLEEANLPSMKNISKNWKTTLAGVLGLAAVVVKTLAPEYAVILESATALAISLGLIAAKDGDKTGL